MSKRSNLAKLELTLKYIDDIGNIIVRHGTIGKALTDFEGEYVVLMCLTQVGETINKIDEDEIISQLPVSKIIGLRNRIVHGYEDVDKTIITKINNAYS